MALSASDVDIEQQKAAGRTAAIQASATEHKTTGQTSPDQHPFTYWWVVGYNEAIDQGLTQS